jgi:deoxyribose-phosphate aldolase
MELQELAEQIGEAILCGIGVRRSGPELAGLIDHTLLKPDATRDQVAALCGEARRYGFATVCVNPAWVALASSELAGSAVKVCTVAGFPLGADTTCMKMAEAAESIRLGAREIDMVIQVGALLAGDYDAVQLDIRGVAEVVHSGGALLKVILETALLTDDQKAAACAIAKMAGAGFVKTSTGFGPGGATARDVALMRQVVGPDTGVKAAGGIRTLADVECMIAAGADRIGTSSSVSIMESAAF